LLSPCEFTLGKVGSVTPLSLILPTSKYEVAMIIGHVNEVATAVFLSGQYSASCIQSEGNERWGGIIIPNVRIEIDETSPVDSNNFDTPLLSMIRTDTRLVVAAKNESAFGGLRLVTLHNDLVSAGDFQTAFTKWQVVLGDGEKKRVVWSSEMSA